MRSNVKHSAQALEKYIQLYLNGVDYEELVSLHGLKITRRTLHNKLLIYEDQGISGLESSHRNKSYSQAFKLQVIQEHLQEGTAYRVLARKYRIPSDATVRCWINRYTKGKEIQSYQPKPEVYHMISKHTTQEERLQIVQDYLTQTHSYKDTAQKFQVPYHNVYAWVQKYQKHGPDGLVDGRGRHKPESIMTEEEKLKLELKALKARNQYLETENYALKKLQEVESELILAKRNFKQNTKQSKHSKKKDMR